MLVEASQSDAVGTDSVKMGPVEFFSRTPGKLKITKTSSSVLDVQNSSLFTAALCNHQ